MCTFGWTVVWICVRASRSEREAENMTVTSYGAGLRKPVEICKFAVVSVETGDRLLAKHIATVTFCDHVQMRTTTRVHHAHTRTRTHLMYAVARLVGTLR